MFHHVIVPLERLGRVPIALLLAPFIVLDGALAGWLGLLHAGALLLAHLADCAVLRVLPRYRISFGPVQTQWLTLAVLRLLAALALAGAGAWLGFDAGWSGVALQAAGFLLMLDGFVFEPASLTLSRMALDVPSLPPGETVSLLHVADIHLERHGTRENQLLEYIRTLHPDAVLFTGDFLNLSNTHDPEAQWQARALWTEICDLAPVYAVSGSPPVDPHDVVGKIVDGLPIHWLKDELVELTVRDHHVHIVGVTCSHDPHADGERLRRALGQRDSADGNVPFTVLLHHAPDLAPQAAATALVDMHLAGHTHGGQVRLPGFGALMTNSIYHKQLEMGLYRLGDMLLYVSRGIGLEGKGAPRVRFLCPPELTLIELVGAG